MPPLIGSRLRRLEDPSLITGRGRYAGDVALPDLVHLAVFRSRVAQARISAGESGTIPVPAALSNAVEDALRQVRPDVLVGEIPITPNRIFDLLGPS